MSEPSSDRPAERSVNTGDEESKTLAKSVGEVASPLLAGFSFTNIIVVITSSDIRYFLFPGEAIIFWTIASIAFVVTVQYAKYVAEGEAKWGKRVEYFYHLGVFTFLIGFGFALAPQPGAEAYKYRWIASGIAFVAFLAEAGRYGKWKCNSRRR